MGEERHAHKNRGEGVFTDIVLCYLLRYKSVGQGKHDLAKESHPQLLEFLIPCLGPHSVTDGRIAWLDSHSVTGGWILWVDPHLAPVTYGWIPWLDSHSSHVIDGFPEDFHQLTTLYCSL